VTRLSGTYAYYAYRDYAKATAQYEKIIRLQPNDPTGYASLGLIQRRQGRWAESLVTLQRAIELDPASVSYTRALLSTYTYIRRWNEALAMQRRLITLLPGQLREELALADTEFAATGSFKAVDELLARLTPAQKDSPVAIYYRKNWAWARDDYAEYQRLDKLQPAFAELENPAWSAAFAGIMHLIHGDAAAAQARIAESYAETKVVTEKEPGNLRAWLFLGTMEAILGHKEEAVRLTMKTVDLLPVTRDAIDGPSVRTFLIWVYALTGDKDRAIAEVARTVQTPNLFSVHRIWNDAACFSLREDPRFKALINDPKNNAPLF
jgi:tetratricopeptide (TPR) repeat protein